MMPEMRKLPWPRKPPSKEDEGPKEDQRALYMSTWMYVHLFFYFINFNQSLFVLNVFLGNRSRSTGPRCRWGLRGRYC